MRASSCRRPAVARGRVASVPSSLSAQSGTRGPEPWVLRCTRLPRCVDGRCGSVGPSGTSPRPVTVGRLQHALARTELFLWTFLAAAPLEVLAVSGQLTGDRSSSRDAAFAVAADWRHGMALRDRSEAERSSSGDFRRLRRWRKGCRESRRGRGEVAAGERVIVSRARFRGPGLCAPGTPARGRWALDRASAQPNAVARSL